MIVSTLIVGVVVLVLAVLLYPGISQAIYWRAIVTPLASIIGSGFLVLGPILGSSFGFYAPIVMLMLCAVAFAFGHAIRFNIKQIEVQPQRKQTERTLEACASWVLAFAYVISVAYYLNLFGAFGVSLTSLNDVFHARLLTSGVLLTVLIVGWHYGFTAMEQMEQVTVSLKLAIIAGLIVGLAIYFYGNLTSSSLRLDQPVKTGWSAFTLAFGLIVTVQGFEISRYLGNVYDATVRVRSMRRAQYLSAFIYVIYIVLVTYSFDAAEFGQSETAIISIMSAVAPILPLLLVAAALSAQFSAAVADTGGAGGLVQELSGGKISPRQAYVLLIAIGLVMTWTANIFEIIAYASRAFALYYSIQALIAMLNAFDARRPVLQIVFYASLAILGFIIVVFGDTVE